VGTDGDASCVPGSDSVGYAVNLRGKKAARVEVAFVYQTLSARFARELFMVDTPEVRAFRTMFERADRLPALIAAAHVDL
jgi:hypothetical protein